jgi:hypothetical protein
MGAGCGRHASLAPRVGWRKEPPPTAVQPEFSLPRSQGYSRPSTPSLWCAPPAEPPGRRTSQRFSCRVVGSRHLRVMQASCLRQGGALTPRTRYCGSASLSLVLTVLSQCEHPSTTRGSAQTPSFPMPRCNEWYDPGYILSVLSGDHTTFRWTLSSNLAV